ncbi:hypothetical protein ACFWXM_18785 [Achromobacter xylosoxidans]|uniref:hypothetical protein n=1 Tax=Alcaligenes xylosoxydans xylosoxydans TaxID=85698 RepID=UPI0022B89716|nr:hypothetical protein [Achromobacter xylosoxidans]MCZ8383278.1 hypothetical protein [Achromobacter xylosoxidans]
MKPSVDSEAAVGEKMVDVPWLDALKKALISTGLDSEDLYALLEASIVTEKINFPAFIYDASRGFGFTVSEGFSYSLDQNWDDPESFNEVSFFLGEMETSSISVPDYVSLMKIAADIYSAFFPDEGNGVLRSAERLKERYSRRL